MPDLKDEQLRGHLLTLAAHANEPHKVTDAIRFIEAVIVRPVCRRIARNWPRHVELDDVTQQALFAIAKAANTYDPEQPAAPFLSTIAHNVIVTEIITASAAKRRINALAVRFADTQRKATGPSRATAKAETLAETYPDPRQGPEQASELADLYRRTLDTLKTLLTSLELAALIAYTDGRTYEEIAASHNITLKQVDNALQRARKKIDTELSDSPQYGIAHFARKTHRGIFGWIEGSGLDGPPKAARPKWGRRMMGNG